MSEPLDSAASNREFARWIRPFWIAWVLAVFSTFLFRQYFTLPGLEAFLLLGPVLAMFAARGTLDAFKNSARKYQAFSLALLSLVAGGILFKMDAHIFPFVCWDMFSKTQYGVPSAIQCKATLSNGDEITFHPGKWITAVSESRIAAKIEEQIDRLPPGDLSPEQARLASLHQRTLAALAGLYNEQHPKNPILALAVYRVSMKLPQEGKPLTKVPQFLWAFNLESASP